MGQTNRRWLLGDHPEGPVELRHFVRGDEELSAEVGDGQVLVRVSAVHCAPTVRNSMNASTSDFTLGIRRGDVVSGPVGGRVVESRADSLPVGSRVVMRAGWQDFSVVDLASTEVQVIAPGTSILDALGPVGLNSLTAYFGVTRVGAAKAGDVMVVSGAAGSTGSMAAQIGRLLGCRVVGIAGGPDKCRWLTDELGLDAAIDYKSESVSERIAELCPDGVDLFYDNVGGDVLTAVYGRLARFARVVVCGQIAGYDAGQGGTVASFDMLRLIYGAITIRGFVMRDYAAEFDAARAQLGDWIRDGRLRHREDVHTGFDDVPAAFLTLFDGSNDGTVLVEIDDDARATS